MNMVRQIFRYGITIAIVIGISLAYVYRQKLFPMFFEANQLAKKTEIHSAGNSGVQSPASTVQSAPEPVKQSSVKLPVPQKPVPAKPPVREKAPDIDSGKVAGGKAGQDIPENRPAPSGIAPVQQPLPAENIPPQNHMQDQREQAPQPEVDYNAFQKKQEELRQYLAVINQARLAYWLGKYKESIGFYQQAIKLTPDNPETYGELGNLYYSQGEWDKAGENLYQSANRLLDNRQAGKVYHLLTIIRGLKPDRARELEERLKKLTSR